MQGFPTLFAYQIWHDQINRKCFSIPDNYSTYFSNLDATSYTQLLNEMIVGNHLPEEVVLLEILPHQQKQKLIFILQKNILEYQLFV